jgi:hypothetical protein
MKARHITSLLGILALAMSLNAGAATVSVQASSAQVPQSSAFTVNLVLSAADAPGDHPALISGQVVVDFNPALISYVIFTPTGGAQFWSGTGVVTGSSGGRTTLTIGLDNMPESGTAGIFTFLAVGAPQSIATIGLADADDFLGTFVNVFQTNHTFVPTFNGTSVTISAVPLPGGAWLMVTAFGIAASRLRRNPRAVRATR